MTDLREQIAEAIWDDPWPSDKSELADAKRFCEEAADRILAIIKERDEVWYSMTPADEAALYREYMADKLIAVRHSNQSDGVSGLGDK